MRPDVGSYPACWAQQHQQVGHDEQRGTGRQTGGEVSQEDKVLHQTEPRAAWAGLELETLVRWVGLQSHAFSALALEFRGQPHFKREDVVESGKATGGMGNVAIFGKQLPWSSVTMNR